MKILDIIIPNETLDEGSWSDLVANGKKIANDVGEFTGIKGLRNAESRGVSANIDKALSDAGKDLKRSKGLAAAEKELLDLEKTINLKSGSKKDFDIMAEYLANQLIKNEGNGAKLLAPLEVPTLKIREFAKTGADITPENAWMKNIKTSQDFDSEFNDWLRQSVNARIKIKQEIDNAPLAPTPPKTKEEKEADDAAAEKKETDDLANQASREESKAKISTANRIIKENKKAEKALVKWWELNQFDYGFLSLEAVRIFVQNLARYKDVEEWEQKGEIPADVATYFPKVIKEGVPQTSKDPKDPKEYWDEKSRVEQAATWMKSRIIQQAVSQVGGLGFGMFMGQGLIGLGGGTMGKASWMKNFFTPFISLTGVLARKVGGKRGNAVADATAKASEGIITGLGYLSQAGKMMMADYWASAVTDQQTITKPLTTYSNKLPDSVWASLKVDHVPDINKAFVNLYAMVMLSDSNYQDSEFIKMLWGGLIASSVPAQLPYTPLLAAVQALRRYFSIDTNLVPPAKGKIPGKDNVAPEQTTTGDTGSSTEADNISGENPSGTTTTTTTLPEPREAGVAAANDQRSPPAVDNGKKVRRSQPDTASKVPGFDESINENLKRRVAQLMKS